MLAAFFKSGLMDLDAPDYSHSIRWRNNRRTCRFFSGQLRETLAQESRKTMEELRYPSAFKDWGYLEKAQYLEIEHFMSQYLLSSQGDRVGMAHSVEGRFPFLDFRVVDYCMGLPSRYKLRGLREKHILREVANGLLPDDIGHRRKRPYRAPIHKSFFNATTPTYLEALLSESRVKEAGLFEPAAVAQLKAKVLSGISIGESDDMAVAGIISTQLCWEQFVANFPKSEGLRASDDVLHRGFPKPYAGQ
jgi:asparagine synthase (glutamine-hydrolysing)